MPQPEGKNGAKHPPLGKAQACPQPESRGWGGWPRAKPLDFQGQTYCPSIRLHPHQVTSQ